MINVQQYTLASCVCCYNLCYEVYQLQPDMLVIFTSLFFSIQIIKEKLDSEGLGIFLVSSFMDEFFSKSQDNDEQRRNFELYHYNGIKRSNESNKVPIESIN